MSCYLRHLKDVLDEAGIKVTQDNRKKVDQALHALAGVKYKDCPGTWKKLKLELAGSPATRKTLIAKIKKALPT